MTHFGYGIQIQEETSSREQGERRAGDDGWVFLSIVSVTNLCSVTQERLMLTQRTQDMAYVSNK